MKRFIFQQTCLAFVILILNILLITGCSSGGGGSTGNSDTTAPTVTAVVPLNNATGVAINTKIITAAFSEGMDHDTLTSANFTLACPAATPVTGAVTYSAAGNVATLTLPATPNLPPSTLCAATITTGAKDTTGNALASNFVWTFRTGLTPDVTRPRVTITSPVTTIPGPTAGVPTNMAITAIFTEDMAPATITAASFTLTGPDTTPVAARALNPVTYIVGSRTAIFWPAAELAPSTTYTATITTAATDIAGNHLAGNQAALPAASSYVWTFTTSDAVPTANISVLSTTPAADAGGVCPSATVNVTFAVPSGLRIDPGSLVGTMRGPTGSIDGTSAFDVSTGDIFTYTPRFPLEAGTYTVTVYGTVSGVRDLAIPANTMLSDYSWTFTVVPATGVCIAPIALNSASTFGSLSCAALTGSTMEATGTTVNGDIGTMMTSTSITNFVGGGTPATPGIVNGTIYASDLPTAGDFTSFIAVADSYIAFQAAQTVGLTGTVVPTSDLGAIAGFGPPAIPGTFYAGAYKSGDSIAISTPVTLDPQGDANAVWIFYAPSTLITSGTGNIILLPPAQAKNVFWVVGSSATLGAPAFSGNILAATAISVGTVGVTVDGRLLVSGPTCAAVTFDAHLHYVNVPAP
jgi:hypothetical protein